MNVKSIFGSIGEVLSGIGAVSTGLVSISILSTVVFGSGWLGTEPVKHKSYTT
jgi:hypothetical protein